MTVDQLIGKIYTKLSHADISEAEGKVAVQFNLTGKVTGVFYVEILNGVLSVMPYEYIDRDAQVSGTLTNVEKIVSGKLIPQVAIAEGKLAIEGNVDKVMLLAELLKQK
ncbi:SCP2 sterol-binding domain-containing protein [Butyricicoccus sp. Marseille-Q5471]|uniref:SCP2 sterol-binding domain-containing protein n=1 Tax=Butyricicoccus sp. Marseille-Q5471 TaxID=3039493 RepID=UPI0024BC46CA|nr:SCP2 sterol-binding domain-containing protein [Butyricicoccus sp. Marseille-Q5471]